jgi:hypothetical protein
VADGVLQAREPISGPAPLAFGQSVSGVADELIGGGEAGEAVSDR